MFYFKHLKYCLIAVLSITITTTVKAQEPSDSVPIVSADATQTTVSPDTLVEELPPLALALPDSLLQVSEPSSLYDLPYSRKLSMPNKRRLVQNTLALYGGGLVALGVLELLPEDATAWNKEEARHTRFFKRWWNHVKKGAVWDKDSWIFNYVLHPYGGAAYYMSARSQGLNNWQSMLYSFGISTVFWEYGIEAFMEDPSIQDLIVTPVAGSLIGESFYRLKRNIVEHDYRLLGSKVLGNVVACLIDPVNEFMGIFVGNPCRGKKRNSQVSVNSLLMPHSFSMSVTF